MKLRDALFVLLGACLTVNAVVLLIVWQRQNALDRNNAVIVQAIQQGSRQQQETQNVPANK